MKIKFTNIIRKIYYLLSAPFIAPRISKNIEIKNAYVNQECYIFLTGPMINDIDLTWFKGKNTFICNHFYRHKDVTEMDPLFFSCVENADKTMKYTDTSGRSISLIENVDKKCNRTILLLHETTEKYLRKYSTAIDRKVYYFSPMRDAFSVNDTINYCKRSKFMGGTVYFLISVAIFMGFKKIYLLGAGYTLTPYQWHHFYDDYNSKELIDQAQLYCDTKPQKEHRVLKEICIREGVDLINVHPDGYKSEIYHGMPLSEFKTRIMGM